MNTNDAFRGAIESDLETILKIVRSKISDNSGNVEIVKQVIVNSSFSRKYEILNTPDSLLIATVIVCLLYSSINPYVANTPAMALYKKKIEQVCNDLGLDENNIYPVSTIEEKLYRVLL